MEYNKNISTAYSALNDISASQMNTLLTLDSPPVTPLEPSHMILTNNQCYDDSIATGKCNSNNVGDTSLMRFNNQQLPSQIESQFEFSFFNNDDLSNAFSEPWSLTDEQNEQNSCESQQKIDESVIITTPVVDHIILEDTELPEPLNNDIVESQQKNLPNKSNQLEQSNLNFNITPSQQIDEIQLDFAQIPEIPEYYNMGVNTQKDSENHGLRKQNDITLNVNGVYEFSTKANGTTNDSADFEMDAMDDIDFEEIRKLEQVANKSQAKAQNASGSKQLTTELREKTVNDLTKSNHSTNMSIRENHKSDNVVHDLYMEPLDDVDFEELSSLEKAFAGGVKVNRGIVQRQCQTQQELNPLRPSITEKSVASCPPPPLVKLSLDNTENNSHNPMDFLELTYSKGSSSIRTQQLLTQLSLPSNVVDVTTELSQSQSSLLYQSAASLPTQTDSLDFTMAPDNANNHNNSNETQSSTISSVYISKSPSLASTLLRFNNSTADATMLPLSVKQLYDVIKEQYSDFSFMYALSAQLCQDRIPMDCFVALKMALLLSLVSIGTNPDRPPIPIIAIGSDTYMTNYLMTTVGQLATRFVGPTDDTKPPSSNGYRNHNWIEADPIQLAQGGVYYVGDWSRLKLLRAERLYKDLESCTITVEKSTQTYPLQTAIWAHWRSFKNSPKDQQMFNKFVKIFGIPIYVADDNHETLVNYTLEQTSIRIFESTVDHLSITVDDMQAFLIHVSQRNVDVTPEASLLLQKYFVASRLARPDCLSKQAFIALKQFSESFAKISLRHEVLTIDALSAIILCEHSIENIFGVGDNSPPHFGSVPFVGAVDEYLLQFEKWLDSYIEKYYKD